MVPELAHSEKKQEKKRKVKALIEPIPESIADGTHAGKSKLARALGSCDYHSREKGVQALTRFLQRKTAFEERDMLKIWKGLFYAFWHSDKQPVQMELADRLAAVLSDLQPQVAFLYFSCFMSTMRREWFGIDRLRLDKFLMLIRKFVGRLLKLLHDSKWQKDLVSNYMGYLHDHVLLPSDSYRAAGIAYHLFDIFIPELLKMVAGAAAEPSSSPDLAAVPGEALGLLLQPFCKTLAAAGEAPLLTRIREGVFDSVLEALHDPGEGAPLRHLDVPGLAAQLFELGARQEMRARNREALYSLSAALERTHAKRQKKQASQAGAGQGAQADAGVKTTLRNEGQPCSSAAGAAAAAPPVAPVAEAGAALTKKKKRKVNELSEAAPSAAGPLPAGVDADAGGSTAAPLTASTSKASGAQGQPRVVGWNRGAAAAAAPAPTAAVKKAQLVAVHGAARAGGSAAEAPVLASGGQRLAGGAAAVKARRPEEVVRDAEAAVGSAGRAGDGAAGARQATPVGAGTGKADKTKAGKSSGKSLALSTKKRVQINLKKNLYFDFGGPVPPADIRTPQTARSKGGILKKKAGLAGPHSAPPKSSHGHEPAQHSLQHANGGGSADKVQQRRGASALKASRPRAALFF